jgi:tripartite-type tricarboxylate transporter receptor subunit TctC
MKKGRMVRFAIYGLAIFVGLGIPVFATAQDYPTKQIELIEPYGAGGPTYIAAKIVSEKMSELLNKPVVVITKPGAGGTIGAAFAAKARSDGYTLLVFNSGSNGVSLAIRSDLTYKNSDFELLGQYGAQYLVMAVKADAPWKSVKDIIDYAKKNPGTMKYGTSGIGTSLHFGMELFKIAAGGLKIDHVPFKAGPEINAALLGGHIHTGTFTYGVVKALVEAGKLRNLAITAPKRTEDLPDVPTFAELGLPEVTLSSWYGIAAPKGIPREVAIKMQDICGKAFQDPEIQKRLIGMGYMPTYRNAAEFAKFVAEQEKMYDRVAKAANIRVQ